MKSFSKYFQFDLAVRVISNALSEANDNACLEILGSARLLALGGLLPKNIERLQ
jgi:hypothetical protein